AEGVSITIEQQRIRRLRRGKRDRAAGAAENRLTVCDPRAVGYFVIPVRGDAVPGSAAADVRAGDGIIAGGVAIRIPIHFGRGLLATSWADRLDLDSCRKLFAQRRSAHRC